MSATARSVNDDLFQNHKFHIFDSSGFFTNLAPPAAGFSSISMPEMNFDNAEYREGLDVYSRKQTTRPHFTPLTLHKGVAKTDSNFFKSARSAAEGKTYRTDITIKQFHKTDLTGLINYMTATASREIRCYNCIPGRFRAGSDFDAQNADVSIEEMDWEVEYFRLYVNGKEVTV